MQPVERAERMTDNPAPVEHAERMTDNPAPEDQDAGSVTSTSTDWEHEFGIRATPPIELSSPPLSRMPTNFGFLLLTSYVPLRVNCHGVFHPR